MAEAADAAVAVVAMVAVVAIALMGRPARVRLIDGTRALQPLQSGVHSD